MAMHDKLYNEIRRLVRESSANLQEDGCTPYFEEPLLGVAAADDPLFDRFKGIIGDFHLTPGELLAGATAVICWVLPIAEPTRLSNRRERQFPSRAWARTRDLGEAFNVLVRRQLVAWLEEQGYRALAPQLSQRWQAIELPESGPASNWSERHAAYAAGLGTFSLNDALITQRGIAHRLGTVLTDCPLPPTPRSYSDHTSNCLHFRADTCRLCIPRCPVGALSARGHDKIKCRAYVYGTVPDAVATGYGVKATGCGLCQTGVPCEFRIPAAVGSG
jgi:epoxyqueuosine reductase QueG